MATASLHEAPEDLSPATREMHRALSSLIEELEAVDWYAQRIDATADDELAAVLVHNRDEEKEHACMTLEWIRRRDPVFDRFLRRFLFRTEPIVSSEHAPGEASGAPASRAALERTLAIGSLRHANGRPTEARS